MTKDRNSQLLEDITAEISLINMKRDIICAVYKNLQSNLSEHNMQAAMDHCKECIREMEGIYKEAEDIYKLHGKKSDSDLNSFYWSLADKLRELQLMKRELVDKLDGQTYGKDN